MNSLFKQLNPSKESESQAIPVRCEVVEEMASQGFKMNIGDFMRFAKMMQGRDAGGIVQQLLDSGQMSQQQFNALKTKAQGFIKLYNHFKR